MVCHLPVRDRRLIQYSRETPTARFIFPSHLWHSIERQTHMVQAGRFFSERSSRCPCKIDDYCPIGLRRFLEIRPLCRARLRLQRSLSSLKSQGPPSTNIEPFNSLYNNQVTNIIMMISNSTFAHWLSVMNTPDGAEEATETRNAWHVISKDFRREPPTISSLPLRTLPWPPFSFR